MIRHHVLERTQWVPCPVSEVFEFFSSARNLEVLTPPWLKFRIVTLPISIETGSIIRYRIRWRGIPIFWTTEIETWEPPHKFIDQQLSGPYALWHHTHTFEPLNGGTQLSDLVRYAVPFGPLGRLSNTLFVRRDVETIFDYRQQRISEMFGAGQRAAFR